MSGTQQLLLTEGGGAAPTYIEDVFSTWLYTGNSTSGGTQAITNNIDLSTKGGMVWIKGRSAAANNMLYDTARGAGTGSASGSNKALSSNSTAAQGLALTSDYLSAFSTTGFSVTQGGATTALRSTNYNGVTYSSWTFRKQPKFFDVVTYTGDGAARDVAHSLGSVPGCMIIKRTDGVKDWIVYHRSLSTNQFMNLNSTGSVVTGTQRFPSAPTSTVFSLGTDTDVNGNGFTYVAYLFAHDAGGFGLTGTDNVISCGSFTTNASGIATVNLGYEPQWVLLKLSSAAGQDWRVIDTMRGFTANGSDQVLNPNLSGAEYNEAASVYPTSTGFGSVNAGLTGSQTYIYIAIRRGPMKVPTDATKVFAPTASSDSTGTQITTGFPVDMQLSRDRSNNDYTDAIDRLRGVSTNSTEEAYTLETSSTVAESYTSGLALSWGNTGFKVPNTYGFDPKSAVYWSFRRAPSFFDEVCYTGTGSAQTQTHNLGAAPELMIVKCRSASATSWPVYSAALGTNKYVILNGVSTPSTNTTTWNNTAPTSTVFSVGSSDAFINASGSTYVAYLFATCAGVSKVGSYTGNGSTQAIACGFTGGARFVLIKRTDSTGGWYVYDTARGMTTLTDPYLFMNSIAAESATLGSVTTTTGGFTVDASILAAINTNAASYIFLAIA